MPRLPWTPARQERLRSLVAERLPIEAIADRLGCGRQTIVKWGRLLGLTFDAHRGRNAVGERDPKRALRRHVAAPKRRQVVLGDDHKAIVASTTLFPASRVFAEERPRLLISGQNSRKIGKEVRKGKWRGFPIYTLTLVERETCPTSCSHWRDCYGNHMHFAKRLIVDPEFEKLLEIELDALGEAHPAGFVVRLHVLGDFYSLAYVDLWRRALRRIPALRVFGYTARPLGDPIGRALDRLSRQQWDRFALRFSGRTGDRGAVTVAHGRRTRHVICPAQTGKTDCCGTCGLCWQSRATIAFKEH